MSGDTLTTKQRERVRVRLAHWLQGHLEDRLQTLFALREAKFSGPSRGLAFQLVEALGSLPRTVARSELNNITPVDRKRMGIFGVRFGIESIYITSLVKPQAARLRALLWTVEKGVPRRMPPAPGLTSVVVEAGVRHDFYEACGYRVIAGRAIRVDILDRLAVQLRRAAKKGSFNMTPQMINPVGLNTKDAVAVFRELGYVTEGTEDALLFVRRDRKRSLAKTTDDGTMVGRRRRQPRDYVNSPFAKLRELHTPK